MFSRVISSDRNCYLANLRNIRNWVGNAPAIRTADEKAVHLTENCPPLVDSAKKDLPLDPAQVRKKNGASNPWVGQ